MDGSVTTYKTTTEQPPAALLVRIHRIDNGAWLPILLLAATGA
jgi:hypothetical protein